MDFHEFWSFLVFNFEETVLEAQKELIEQILFTGTCIDTFLKKINVRIIHFGPNLDATAASLTQEGIFH